MRTGLSCSLLALLCASLPAAVPTGCPAGVPLGNIELDVQSSPKLPLLPLRVVNRLGEGDKLLYSPVKLRHNGGKVTVVIAPAPPKGPGPAPKDAPRVEVLEPKDADKSQQWEVPFRAGVVALVYGPQGLSAKKVKRFVTQDEDLIAQLADYAEKTAQTEAVLSALANPAGTAASNDAVDSALRGFASQYGVSRIDPNMPRDQQMLAVMRSLNPTLSAVDPVAQDPGARLQQSAMLATSVAGMFLGSTVGLAASGGGLFLNLRAMMFPDTEFRSSFAQVSAVRDLSLCGKREPPKPRTRIAYLWAVRVLNAHSPELKIGQQNHLPAGQKAMLGVTTDNAAWKLVDRARNWRLEPPAGGKGFPVKLHAVPEQKSLEVDLSPSAVPPGQYRLRADWDWDSFLADGTVYVAPLGDFKTARLTSESQDRMREQTGRIVATAEGADFEFLDKAAVMRAGDQFASPVNVPFRTAKGRQEGPQDRFDFEIDTKPLAAGDYSLLLTQAGGQTQTVPFKILPPAPKIANVPLILNAEPSQQAILLKGENLDRLAKLEADGATLELARPQSSAFGPNERLIEAQVHDGVPPGTVMTLRAYAQNTSQPEVVPGGVKVVPPKPEISGFQLSLPSNTEVKLKTGELPAGVFVSASLRVKHVNPDTRVKLRCRSDADEVSLRVGEQGPDGSVQTISPETLFVSFDPGKWQSGCPLSVALDNGAEGQSRLRVLGKVTRLPHLEKLELSEDRTPEGNYIGKLIGTGLETIGKVGWAADQGVDVNGLPAPVEGAERKQSLPIALPWPPPSPHAPLYIWFRGESEGRLTGIRY